MVIVLSRLYLPNSRNSRSLAHDRMLVLSSLCTLYTQDLPRNCRVDDQVNSSSDGACRLYPYSSHHFPLSFVL